MTYSAEVVKNGTVDLELVEYSPAAWGVAKNSLEREPPGATSKLVTIQGQSATLLVIPAGTRPVNTVRLLLVFGDTHVFVAASAGGSLMPGGPDLNPLIDEQTFLAVMQNIRPYPQ